MNLSNHYVGMQCNLMVYLDRIIYLSKALYININIVFFAFLIVNFQFDSPCITSESTLDPGVMDSCFIQWQIKYKLVIQSIYVIYFSEIIDIYQSICIYYAITVRQNLI